MDAEASPSEAYVELEPSQRRWPVGLLIRSALLAGTTVAAAFVVLLSVNGSDGTATSSLADLGGNVSVDQLQSVSVVDRLETIGGHTAQVYNPDGPVVLVILHGMLPSPAAYEDYYPLAKAIAMHGYCVVVFRDNSLPILYKDYEIANAGSWGRQKVRDTQAELAKGRPVAVLGHSLGGHAAICGSAGVPGVSATIVMHPADTHFAGWSHPPAAGPVLFTTGTFDYGETAPSSASNLCSYSKLPKAIINVRGNVHTAPYEAKRGFGNMEFVAMIHWLHCFTKQDAASCEWLVSDMCADPSLRWCKFAGLPWAIDFSKTACPFPFSIICGDIC